MARKNDYIDGIDKLIGNKLSSLRLHKGISRKKLAKIVNVTDQQFIKYENGINRISVGRLLLLSKVLGVDISYFYEGYDHIYFNQIEKITTENEEIYLEVSRNFRKIKNSEYQNAVNIIIRALTQTKAA